MNNENFPIFPRENPRSGIKRHKYKALIIDSRRDKVKELLVKGYSQEEISNTLKISQPTISRDLQFTNNRLRKRLDQGDINNIINQYYLAFSGLDQLDRSLWKIVDNPKSKGSEKLKAIKLLEECSLQRLLIVNSVADDAILPYMSKQMEELDRRDLALKSRERDLENYLKKSNLTTQDTEFKEN